MKKIHIAFDDEGLDVSESSEKDLVTISILGNPVDVKVEDLINAINKVKNKQYQNTSDFKPSYQVNYDPAIAPFTLTNIATTLNNISSTAETTATFTAALDSVDSYAEVARFIGEIQEAGD